MKVNGHWVPCVRNSSYSFMPIHLKLFMCYGHGLKICMWFGYSPWIIFCHFFLARLHEVHRAIVVTLVVPVYVYVYVYVRVTLSVKVFYKSISLDHVDGSCMLLDIGLKFYAVPS